MGLFSTTPEWRQAVADWSGIQNAPAPENRRRVRGFPVFQNPVVEKVLKSSHWVLPGVWFLPVITWCLYGSLVTSALAWTAILPCVLGGILVWTLFEYFLHRVVFHLPPPESGGLRSLLFEVHGYHHEFPSDPQRLVASPMLSWPVAAVLGTLLWLTCGRYWQALFAGLLLGYLAYDWMHYYAHHGRATTRVGRFIRRYHMEHHFKNSRTQFGLSSPLWDLVFGTYRTPTEPTREEEECLGTPANGGASGRADHPTAREGRAESRS